MHLVKAQAQLWKLYLLTLSSELVSPERLRWPLVRSEELRTLSVFQPRSLVLRGCGLLRPGFGGLKRGVR